MVSLLPKNGSLNEALDEVSQAGINAVIPVSIAERFSGQSHDSGTSVYPNPFSGEIHILNQTREDFSIYSIEGRKMFDSRKKAVSEIISIEADSWMKGVYVLVSESGKVLRLMKNR